MSVKRVSDDEDYIIKLEAEVERLKAELNEACKAEMYWRHTVVTTRLCPVDHRKPHISHDCVTEIENRWKLAEADAIRAVAKLATALGRPGLIEETEETPHSRRRRESPLWNNPEPEEEK